MKKEPSAPFEMNVNNQEEQDFFLNSLKSTDNVLEYGSGISTQAIAKRVKHVCSIENNLEWMNKASELPENAELIYVPQNKEPENGHDGTKEEFFDYVQKGIALSEKHGKFDVIFIDGRARVACAEICELIGHKNTKVFIHDYNHPNPVYLRSEYFPAEDFLNRLDGVFTMWQFNIKAFNKKGAKVKAEAKKEVKAPSTVKYLSPAVKVALSTRHVKLPAPKAPAAKSVPVKTVAPKKSAVAAPVKKAEKAKAPAPKAIKGKSKVAIPAKPAKKVVNKEVKKKK